MLHCPRVRRRLTEFLRLFAVTEDRSALDRYSAPYRQKYLDDGSMSIWEDEASTPGRVAARQSSASTLLNVNTIPSRRHQTSPSITLLGVDINPYTRSQTEEDWLKPTAISLTIIGTSPWLCISQPSPLHHPTAARLPHIHSNQLTVCSTLKASYGSTPHVHRSYCQTADSTTAALKALQANALLMPSPGQGQESGGADACGCSAEGLPTMGQPPSNSAAKGGVAVSQSSPSSSSFCTSSTSTHSLAFYSASVAVRYLATQRHVLRSGPSVQNLCVQEILGRAKMNTAFEVITAGEMWGMEGKAAWVVMEYP